MADYWTHIFSTYHEPRYSHPGTCPGCVLDADKWGTAVEPERRDACHCACPVLGEDDVCKQCGAKPMPSVLRIIKEYGR
jgi:hypothetical protein